MQQRFFRAGAILVVLLAACRENPAVVEVAETRPLTSKDQAPKLMATSQERFRRPRHGAPSGHGGVTRPGGGTQYGFTKPDGWTEKPATSIRLLNFAVGPEGRGEVYVSRTRGGDLLGNVARWRRQFGIAETTGEELTKMERVAVMGTGEGLLVEASGSYSPGMGRPESPGQALIGVIAVSEDGAANVGSIQQTFTPKHPVGKGDEKGYFAFGGSSLVTLFEPGTVQLAPDLLGHSARQTELFAMTGSAMASSP